MKKTLIALLVFVLVFSSVMFGCANNGGAETTTEFVAVSGEITDFGSGKTSFVFEIVDIDGNATRFNVHTDEITVGAALQEYDLIKGEQGEFGIYIKEVNGIFADYDVDGTYWAFYVDGEMSMKGADQVEIVDGATYSFRVEKM